MGDLRRASARVARAHDVNGKHLVNAISLTLRRMSNDLLGQPLFFKMTLKPPDDANHIFKVLVLDP